MSLNNYFVGVDVGTGSARAGLVTETGHVVKCATKEIKIWNYDVDFYEQSSDDIWNACLTCIQEVIKGINPKEIKGLGFDATCSLVAIDVKGEPLSVSRSGNKDQNIIMWLDHRASEEAKQITEMQDQILRFTGGKISLEMQTPKLKWLKTNLRSQCWDKCHRFFDLPDFLTWKATNSDSRSLCSLVCKWTYEILADKSMQWNRSYFVKTGLEDLLENDAMKIGRIVKSPGEPVGEGLSEEVASILGLHPGTPVGTSLIDAHSGGLGLIGCKVPGSAEEKLTSKLSLICGTSTCHMAISERAIMSPGIWGPYYSAMVPEMWLNEAGQSVTGKLIDFIIDTHPVTPKIKSKIGKMHIQEYLSKLLVKMGENSGHPVDFLTKDVHVYPDFHGNRSPIADPTLKGMISGLTLSSTEENLAILYLSTIQALCYGTRQIMENLVRSGYESFNSILICGGLSKNALFIKSQANTIGLPVVAPDEPESVLVGASILGACAARHFPDIFEAISCMGGMGKLIEPDARTKSFHERKYQVFLKMLKDQQEYRNVMNGV